MNRCQHVPTKSERKKYCNRPSPPYSASDFEDKTTKKGNDGQMYLVQTNKKGVKQWKVKKNSLSRKKSTLKLIISSNINNKKSVSRKSPSNSLIVVHPFVQDSIIPNLRERGELLLPGDRIILEDKKDNIFLKNREVIIVNKNLETLTIKFLADEKDKQKLQIKFSGIEYPLTLIGKYALMTIDQSDISVSVIQRESFDHDYQRFQSKSISSMSESGVFFGHLGNKKLLESLYQEIQQLSTEDQCMYHPGSNNKVLDIVHPSLYPYVQGLTKTDNAQTSELLGTPKKQTDYWNRPYEESSYQMLPSEFHINTHGKCQIKSYINNLPMSKTNMYRLLERLFEVVLPKFEKIWSYVNSIKLYDQEIGPTFENIDDSYCLSQLKQISLKNKDLQVITKITTTKLNKNSIEGAWHVEGMSHENIVSSCVCVVKQDKYLTADLQFRRRFTICEGKKIEESAAQVREEFMYSYFTDPYYLKTQKKIDSPYKDMIPLGNVSTKTGSLTIFPNSHIHKLDLSTTSSNQERTVIVFWLINPEVRIISTRDIKPQQQDPQWNRKQAERHQLKFMKERKYHKQSFNVRSLNLCEH